MTTLFISDLHLDESRPDITAAFYKFLSERASKADALYILGDFFEAWIGDDEDSNLSREVVKHLKQLSSDGVELFVMHGNRDFLLGQEFCLQTGATLLNDPSCINLYGTQVLIMHGDSLCTEDTAYMSFRQQARSSQWQDHFLSHTIDQRRALVAQMRAQSKDMNSNKSDDIMDVTASEVIAEMEKFGVQIMIHGHTHRPYRHSIPANGNPAERIVLGDWHDKVWYIEASPAASSSTSSAPTIELNNYSI